MSLPSRIPAPRTVESGLWLRIFAGSLGAFLGLTLVKLGNPVILDHLVTSPRSLSELALSPWPVSWGHALLVGMVILGIKVASIHRPAPRAAWLLPLVWFGWQMISATRTVDVTLSRATLFHFAACLLCFYLGLFALSRVAWPTPFWLGLLIAFCWVLFIGFDQHYGGLEATRQLFYEQPNWQQYSPEYLKRIASDRIFATLFYPNALAGAILLVLPALLAASWEVARHRHRIVQGVAVGCLGYAGVACLYWSGSKSGWLIAAGMVVIVLSRLPLGRGLRLLIVGIALLLVSGAFTVRFRPYFQRGATSAVARMDYWRAACAIAASHPVLGSGPGTFSIPYKQIKNPNSEMTKLVHNDYLQQASDSGIPGFLAYSSLLLWSLVALYRNSCSNPVRFAVWLGFLGWAAHGCFEFGLYIPALSWTAFSFLGWLWGTEHSVGLRLGSELASKPNASPLLERA